MLNKLIFGATAALMFGLANVANASVGVTCEDFDVDLFSAATESSVGEVHIECGEDTIMMNFHTHTDGIIFTEINGFLAEDDPSCDAVEVTRKGNPKTKKFPESMAFKRSDEAINETLTFGIYELQPGEYACAVAHADLRDPELSPPFDEAYGAGTLFDDPSNGGTNPSGATFFNILIVEPNGD